MRRSRFVQESVRYCLEQQKEKESSVKHAIEILAANFPSGEYSNWIVCQTLLFTYRWHCVVKPEMFSAAKVEAVSSTMFRGFFGSPDSMRRHLNMFQTRTTLGLRGLEVRHKQHLIA